MYDMWYVDTNEDKAFVTTWYTLWFNNTAK